jgi:hypothetical protein
VSKEPSGPRVAAALEALALQGASGVLRISGNPSGAVYLDQGQVGYAEASWVPGLAARLPELARIGADDDGDHDRDLGALLLAGSHVTKATLKARLKSAALDALLVLTMPLPDRTFIAGTRFETPGSHWASAYARFDIDHLRSQAARKLALLSTYGTGLTSPLELRELSQSWTIIKREHWEVASRINGTSSIRDLAAESGLSLYETIERVAFLLKKEMCVAKPAADEPEVVIYEFARDRKPVRCSETSPAPLVSVNDRPRRIPAVIAPDSGRPDEDDLAASAPSPEQLRRVLDGLRKLS